MYKNSKIINGSISSRIYKKSSLFWPKTGKTKF